MNGTSFDPTKDICVKEVEVTNGQLLHSGAIMFYQNSCRPNTQNVGNLYSWPASTAGSRKSSGYAENSICPMGWHLTQNDMDKKDSFYSLIQTIYSISKNNDSEIINRPLSFVRSGLYTDSSFDGRGSSGIYWAAKAGQDNYSSRAYILSFGTNSLSPMGYYLHFGRKYQGASLRCVTDVIYLFLLL